MHRRNLEIIWVLSAWEEWVWEEWVWEEWACQAITLEWGDINFEIIRIYDDIFRCR